MDTGTSRGKQAGLTAVSRLKEGPYEGADQERGTAVQPLRLGQRDGQKRLLDLAVPQGIGAPGARAAAPKGSKTRPLGLELR